jgi:hypothetical protein
LGPLADNWLSYHLLAAEMWTDMAEVKIYYCWACDAHRPAERLADGRLCCPRCEHELTGDALLPLPSTRSSMAQPAAKVVSAAPVRPRLAA